MTLSNPPALNPNLVERVKGIMLQPTAEWRKIRGETTPVKELFTGYAAVLAAIGPIAAFIGQLLLLLGFRYNFVGAVIQAAVQAVISYILILVGTFILGIIIEALAPNFGGKKDRHQAMKLAVYSSTALWLGMSLSVVLILAPLGALAGAIYTVFLLIRGFPILMKDELAG